MTRHQVRYHLVATIAALAVFASAESLAASIDRILLARIAESSLDDFVSAKGPEDAIASVRNHLIELHIYGAVSYSMAIYSPGAHELVATVEGQSPTIFLKYFGVPSLPMRMSMEYSAAR